MSRTRFSLRCLAALAAAFGLLGTAAPANAFPEFPGTIQEQFGAVCPPTCLLCHDRMEGGSGHFRTASSTLLGGARGYGDFLSNMLIIAHTATPPLPGPLPKEDNLPAHLLLLQKLPCPSEMNVNALPCDSDGDSRSDIDELKDGTDPNVKDTKGDASCPTYGCGASIAPLPADRSDTGRGVALVSALGVGLLLARRFRR